MKFEPTEIHLGNITKRLDIINGKVQEHEKVINTAIADRDSYRVHWNNKVNQLDELMTKVNRIDESLLEYKMVKRYPKMFLIMTVAFVSWMGWEILQHFVLP